MCFTNVVNRKSQVFETCQSYPFPKFLELWRGASHQKILGREVAPAVCPWSSSLAPSSFHMKVLPAPVVIGTEIFHSSCLFVWARGALGPGPWAGVQVRRGGAGETSRAGQPGGVGGGGSGSRKPLGHTKCSVLARNPPCKPGQRIQKIQVSRMGPPGTPESMRNVRVCKMTSAMQEHNEKVIDHR
jgi:hypothetical protein